ncbi:GNAT family N-acetyltransferase [Brachybacterium hainanense]|uniref:GNAT family N-acetyltransferase n=1 Tax=Brachybacterium hainanense TaxID=1541174 RepID=A0ABV6R7A8_9MICO
MSVTTPTDAASVPRIRPALAADAAAVGAIRAAAIAESTGLWTDHRPTPAESAAWAQGHRERGTMLVAEDPGGDVLGYATISPLRDYSGYSRTGEVSIYLAPSAQGRGIGRRLLTALVALGQEQGWHSLQGWIEAGNAASIALHERCGFTEVARIPESGFKFGRWWDLVILHRLL